MQFLLLLGPVMGEAAVAEALDAARNPIHPKAVIASLAARAADSAMTAVSTPSQSA